MVDSSILLLHQKTQLAEIPYDKTLQKVLHFRDVPSEYNLLSGYFHDKKANNYLMTKTSHTLNGIRTLKIQQYRQLNSKLSHGS